MLADTKHSSWHGRPRRGEQLAWPSARRPAGRRGQIRHMRCVDHSEMSGWMPVHTAGSLELVTLDRRLATPTATAFELTPRHWRLPRTRATTATKYLGEK